MEKLPVFCRWRAAGALDEQGSDMVYYITTEKKGVPLWLM